MKHLLFAASLLFFSQPVFSQVVEFCPKGAEWHLGHYSWTSGDFYHTQLNYVADTAVAGFSCKKVMAQSGNPIFYLRQVSDSIYGIENGKWVLLFRTNFQIGDTIRLTSTFFASITTSRVDSIQKLVFGQDTVKKFFLSIVNAAWYGPWVTYDRFGPSGSFFHKDWLGVTDGPSWGLRCYEDSIFSLANLTSKPCDYSFIKTAEPKSDSWLQISPNPTADFLQITTENPTGQLLELTLFDAFGRQIRRVEKLILPEKLDVANLPGGLYFLKIGDEKQGFSVRRFVKI